MPHADQCAALESAAYRGGVQRSYSNVQGRAASCLWQGTTKSPWGIHPKGPVFMHRLHRTRRKGDAAAELLPIAAQTQQTGYNSSFGLATPSDAAPRLLWQRELNGSTAFLELLALR